MSIYILKKSYLSQIDLKYRPLGNLNISTMNEEKILLKFKFTKICVNS